MKCDSKKEDCATSDAVGSKDMEEHIIKLKKPVKKWDDGLPLGNGRLGAMVMGKTDDETIVINEETLCYGPPRQRENKDTRQNLDEIRALLQSGEVEKAAFLAKLSITGTPKYNNPYQPLCELHLSFMGGFPGKRDYESSLSLERAVATVRFTHAGTTYIREQFVSERYQVLVVRIRAIGDGRITMSANLARKPFEESTGIYGKRTAGTRGENGAGGMHYLGAVRIAGEDAKTLGDFVYVEDREEVICYLAAATDYTDMLSGERKEGEAAYADLRRSVDERLLAAEEAGYERIYKEHEQDFCARYSTFSLSLGSTDKGIREAFTEDLLAAYQDGSREAEPYLIELLMAYARYLMIASSSDCLLPANLQGLWNGSHVPPWQSQYTININTEMNYWFVEKAGLSDCQLPLFSLIRLLQKNGAYTAKTLYGCRGFVAHHNANVWGQTAPEGIFDASPFWVMGGAWLCIHLYTHYEYTQDEDFLREALPLMYDAIRFFTDYMTTLPDGTRVTGPVVSPENTYRTRDGQVAALTMGTTMDNSILRELLEDYLKGAGILGEGDSGECASARELLKRIQPLTIGSDGRLLEWHEEYEETEPGHRHISHLYALHPGHEITPKRQELFAAAKKTLDYRLAHGGGHTGWSRAWLACFSARLLDGISVGSNIEDFIIRCLQDNLFCLHPPFQIDGNFGIAEALLESLVQERDGRIYLLPALAPRLVEGELTGYCLTGNRRLSMRWADGRLEWFSICSSKDETVEIYYGDTKQSVSCRKNQTLTFAVRKQ